MQNCLTLSVQPINHESFFDKGKHIFPIFADICDPGWSYFNGYCYFTSETCTNWTTALSKCRQENSVLVNIENNEENVFIQHRHNGAKSWLGLNDISKEGNFTWVDREDGNFTDWANYQPNNYQEEDCVHALGVKYNYEWNDVQCSDCHQYTCKKGKTETTVYYDLSRKGGDYSKYGQSHHVDFVYLKSNRIKSYFRRNINVLYYFPCLGRPDLVSTRL